MIILYIGIGFLALVLGLIVGSVMTDNKIFIVIKDYFNKKKAEKAEYAVIKQAARKQALQELQPELVKHIKQQELEKLTTTKKDKLKKFADMFEMKNNDIGGKFGLSNQGSSNQDLSNQNLINNRKGLQKLQQELDTYIKQEGLDKLTTTKKDELKKFANMFEMNVDDFADKLGLQNQGLSNNNNNKDMSQFLGTQNKEDKQKEKERILSFLK